jgi:hypothetical protein
MRISHKILNQAWEQAAIEQLALDYQCQGYSIKKQVSIADMQADLVAQKDNDVIFFEFKSGKWDTVKVNQVLKLRNYVVQNQAGKFKLVLVNRPAEKQVEIDGLKDILYKLCLDKAMPELRQSVTPATLEKVSELEIHSSKIRPQEIEVKGSVIAHFQTEINQTTGDSLPVQDSFLVTFYLTLSHELKLKKLYEFNFELSDFCE